MTGGRLAIAECPGLLSRPWEIGLVRLFCQQDCSGGRDSTGCIVGSLVGRERLGDGFGRRSPSSATFKPYLRLRDQNYELTCRFYYEIGCMILGS